MVRINKKRPFSQPNSVRVNEIELEIDRLYNQRSGLLALRKAIVEGNFTESLYNFLNADGSMEELLIGLPPVVDGIACEALREEQLVIVDAAIEGLGQKIKDAIARMWEAFKEWFLDWWDLNRNTRIKLNAKLAAYKQNAAQFGNPADFETVQATVYHKPYWLKMVAACNMMNELFLQIPSKDLGKWVEANRPKMSTCCAEFGQFTGPGLKVEEQGHPKYDVVQTTLGAARWRFALLEQDMKDAIDVLSNEIEYRKTFSALEKLFKNADIEERNYLAFMRQIVMRFKSNAFTTARGLDRVLRAAISAAKK